MNEISSQNSHPGRLAELLTELVNRLRLSSSSPSDRFVLPSYPRRLDSAARLLACAGAREQDKRFLELARVLGEYNAWVGANPGRCPRRLDRPFDVLLEFMERLLVEIDAGMSVNDAVTDNSWEAVRVQFLEEKEQNDPGFFRQPIRSDSPLQQPVLRLRGRDAVFGLLLDSPFQRDEILAKINAAGSRVLVLDGPAAAAGLIAEKTGSVVLLGDNLEPSRNLERVASLLPPAQRSAARPYVLVCGSVSGRIDPQRRAEALGAMGAWAPPHQLDDLRRVLREAVS